MSCIGCVCWQNESRGFDACLVSIIHVVITGYMGYSVDEVNTATLQKLRYGIHESLSPVDLDSLGSVIQTARRYVNGLID